MTTPTNSSLSHERRIAVRDGLRPVAKTSWLAGFGNMLGKELGEWFGTRRWIWQTIIWLTIINGFIAFMLFLIPQIDPATAASGEIPPADIMGLTLYLSFAVTAGAMGMIILAQDEIIQEKQTGTAAWVFSKPAARQSFILTKIAANMIGGLVFIVGLPALVTLGEVYLASGQWLQVLPLIAAIGIVLIALYFYLSLVILLGVIFNQRGAVLGIAFGFLFGGAIAVSLIPQVGYIFPVSMDNIALTVAQGQALPEMAVFQVVATVVWGILFTLGALWRFERVEF